MAYATVAALNIYPVKSCRGTPLEHVGIGSTGLLDDRRWMVVTDTGRFLTQRELPRLALVAPTLHERQLTFTAPGMAGLVLSTEANSYSLQVTIWRDHCAAFDSGDQAAEWLSTFLERPVRLVQFDPTSTRHANRQWTGAIAAPTQFSDGYPILVISKASLDDLNKRLVTPVPMNRFRPNLVLDGLQAYEEDRIHELLAGELRLRLVKPCNRCKITTTDQSSGEVMGEEPLKTLKTYRWSQELRGVLFGQNAIVIDGAGAQLCVGQRLEITWKP
jgi:uncharacterized protein YcbX